MFPAPDEERRQMAREDARADEVIQKIVKDLVDSIITQAISEVGRPGHDHHHISF